MKNETENSVSADADGRIPLNWVPDLERILGYHFSDPELLIRAMTHSSSTPDKQLDNERLEFFGDSILDFLVCEKLYHTCPESREGVLTEVKSTIVRRRSLARAARRLDVREYLILGKGIANRDALPQSVYANVFEAIVAAIYLDGGYEAARCFVMAHLAEELSLSQPRKHLCNYKSLLQQWVQKSEDAVPLYRVTREWGPDHAKMFEVAVLIDERELGRGEGQSKKEAEQNAACAALHELNADGIADTP